MSSPDSGSYPKVHRSVATELETQESLPGSPRVKAQAWDSNASLWVQKQVENKQVLCPGSLTRGINFYLKECQPCSIHISSWLLSMTHPAKGQPFNSSIDSHPPTQRLTLDTPSTMAQQMPSASWLNQAEVELTIKRLRKKLSTWFDFV